MAAKEPLGLAAFAPSFRERSGEPEWLSGLRRDGFARFSEGGLPTNRDEAWKYTSLRPIARAKYEAAPANDDAAIGDLPALMLEGSARAVFINGRLAPALSDLDGLADYVSPLADALGAEWVQALLGRKVDDAQVMYALNAALFDDGLAIRVPDGDTMPRPLEILFVAAPGERALMWHPRMAIDIGQNARATIIERHIGPAKGAYLANHGADIRVADGAVLTHAKAQLEGGEGRHLAMARVSICEGSIYDNFVLTLGAALSRNEVATSLDGSDSEVRLNGAYMLGDRQHADHSSRIDHLAPDTRSRQVYSGAIGDNARGVFQGHIVVDQIAQKTDGHQLNRALLLSDHAEIDSKPVLEIYADDVKCSHGATAGDIDDDQLFYLRARGIPAEQARLLVVRGFLAATAEGLGDEAVRNAMLAELDKALGLEGIE